MRCSSREPSGFSITSANTTTPPGAERTTLCFQCDSYAGEDLADRLVAAPVAAEPLERGRDRLLALRARRGSRPARGRGRTRPGRCRARACAAAGRASGRTRARRAPRRRRSRRLRRRPARRRAGRARARRRGCRWRGRWSWPRDRGRAGLSRWVRSRIPPYPRPVAPGTLRPGRWLAEDLSVRTGARVAIRIVMRTRCAGLAPPRVEAASRWHPAARPRRRGERPPASSRPARKRAAPARRRRERASRCSRSTSTAESRRPHDGTPPQDRDGAASARP